MGVQGHLPFIAKIQPIPELLGDEVLDELLEAKRLYNHETQTSGYALQAGTSQTYNTTRSGGPILFSDDDSKACDG